MTARQELSATVRIARPLPDVYAHFLRNTLTEDDGEDAAIIDERVREVREQLQQWNTATRANAYGRLTFVKNERIEFVSTDDKPYRSSMHTFQQDGDSIVVNEHIEWETAGLQRILGWIIGPLLRHSLRTELREQRDLLEAPTPDEQLTTDN